MYFSVIDKKNIVVAIRNKMEHDKMVLNDVLMAYNRYQEDEREGVDYIFDLTNEDDLITCIKGGLRADDIAHLWNETDSRYIFYGVNHAYPAPLTSDEIFLQLDAHLDDIVTCMVAYPFVEEYKNLYVPFVTNKIINDVR